MKKSVEGNSKKSIKSVRDIIAGTRPPAAKTRPDRSGQAVMGKPLLKKTALKSSDEEELEEMLPDSPDLEQSSSEPSSLSVEQEYAAIDEIHEAIDETRHRKLPPGETAADVSQLATRLDDAQAGLARAVEAKIQHNAHPQETKTAGRGLRKTATGPGRAGKLRL